MDSAVLGANKSHFLNITPNNFIKNIITNDQSNSENY